MKLGTVLSLALCGLLAAGRPAFSEIGTIDDVPAATLLLPYFEVDLADPDGVSTLFSVNNAAGVGVLTRVTLWTDEAIPTLGFDLYLTAYDVKTINLRNVFEGVLPVSQLPAIPSCAAAPPLPSPLSAAIVDHLRAAHTGRASAVFGGKCSGFPFGDSLARGYITADVVRQCGSLDPSSPGYFSTVAGFLNVLWGDYFYIHPSQGSASGETLVGIEACAPDGTYRGRVGNGAAHCPLKPGEYTFYGRYVAGDASDRREPLPTSFATRYVEGGAFNRGTELLVWRDTKVPPAGGNGPFDCNSLQGPAWFPIDEQVVAMFDEQEHAYEDCYPSDWVTPVGGPRTCFPLGAQRIFLGDDTNPTGTPSPPYSFGWMYLNLNDFTQTPGRLFGSAIQGWVTTAVSAEGRYSVGFDAIQVSPTGPNPDPP